MPPPPPAYEEADDILGVTSGAPSTRTAKDPNLLIRLLVTDDGVLYEDDMLLLGVKTKCERDGRSSETAKAHRG
eukprot:TRINITY_DN9330_c0_g1_i2.p1 TRINITY_DN9330_c0_g1~~TRINITY_DN9330_c0_g1_i2.p1  ORF type:complete len:74 (+),score=27.22 TRINITY_DN9330_c0_g1_i2:79-300(+)